MYFSKTGETGAKDYLVDHSIIHYLIDPDGEFVTFYGEHPTAPGHLWYLCAVPVLFNGFIGCYQGLQLYINCKVTT